jgi:hypothetical protein
MKPIHQAKEPAMDKTRRTLKRIKNHFAANKAAYVMGAVALAAIALQQTSRIEHDKFLISKGIDPDEFYCPEYYAEKNA